MKIRDIIVENNTTSNKQTVKRSIPKILTFPHLTNTDPYVQYRFGLALAAAAAEHGRNSEDHYEKTSEFGEKLIIAPFTSEEEDIVKLAQKLYGAGSESEQISTSHSEEQPEVIKTSPVAQRKKNKYGI
jgi:hypothetical protein